MREPQLPTPEEAASDVERVYDIFDMVKDNKDLQEGIWELIWTSVLDSEEGMPRDPELGRYAARWVMAAMWDDHLDTPEYVAETYLARKARKVAE